MAKWTAAGVALGLLRKGANISQKRKLGTPEERRKLAIREIERQGGEMLEDVSLPTDYEKISRLQREIRELERERAEFYAEAAENQREIARTTGRYGERFTEEVANTANAFKHRRIEQIGHRIMAKHDEMRRLRR